MIEKENYIGRIKGNPNILITSSNKSVCKIMLETSYETLRVVAWEELAEDMGDLKKGDIIEVEGYRKYNDYIRKEEFIVTSFIKGMNDAIDAYR